MDKADDIVFHNAAKSRTWRVGLLVNEEASILEDVSVSVNYPGGGRKMTINSPRAECLDGVWYLMNPEIVYYTELGAEMVSPTPELDKLSLRPFVEFDEKPRDFLLQNRDPAFCSTLDRLHYLKMHPALTAETRRGLVYDLAAQIVAPLACLVITLFAIPAGIASGAAVGTAKPAMPRSTSQYMSLTFPASQSAVFGNAARSSSVVMRRYSFRPTV